MSATEDLRDARGADVDVKAEGENPMLVVPASPPETKATGAASSHLWRR